MYVYKVMCLLSDLALFELFLIIYIGIRVITSLIFKLSHIYYCDIEVLQNNDLSSIYKS